MLRGVSGKRFEVFVTSLEAGEAEVAELWLDGARFGHTLLRDGRVVLAIEPRADDQPWEVGAHDLREALAQAASLLRRG
jgi:hypothetical protein